MKLKYPCSSYQNEWSWTKSLFLKLFTITITITNTNTILTYPIIPFSYSLDSSHSVTLLKKLVFKDSCASFLLDKEQFLCFNLKEQMQIIVEFQKALDSVGRKGYLNSVDLTTYPLVSELLPFFINTASETDYCEFINGSKSMDTFKWLHNILQLNNYLLCLLALKGIQQSCDPDLETDLETDLKIRERVLFSKLDPSISFHMRKQGISFIKNTYTGFDTEFNFEDVKRNRLVSAQLAISSKVFIKIPKTPRYTISTMNIKENRLHALNKDSSVFNYYKVENTIQWVMQEIKLMKYGNYEEMMLIITESLKVIKGLKYFEAEDYTLFNLPHSAIQPYICLKPKFSLRELVEISSSISTPYLDQVSTKSLSLLKNICSRNLTIQNGKESLEEEIYNYFAECSLFQLLSEESGRNLPCIIQGRRKERKLRVNKTEKKLSREFLTDLFSGDQKVCITTTRNYYIVAHLTQADLSMLSDFEEVKGELTIVNGSFVTLRDPLKFADRNIHIRDTMLLAPGGSKSLAQIGKLYGEDFNKITISKQNLEDMNNFLKVEPDKFVEYAVRDALISLTHAS